MRFFASEHHFPVGIAPFSVSYVSLPKCWFSLSWGVSVCFSVKTWAWCNVKRNPLPLSTPSGKLSGQWPTEGPALIVRVDSGSALLQVRCWLRLLRGRGFHSTSCLSAIQWKSQSCDQQACPSCKKKLFGKCAGVGREGSLGSACHDEEDSRGS